MGIAFSEQLLELKNVQILPRGEWNHRADRWCLLLVRRGRGTLLNGNSSYSLRTGELAVIPEGSTGTFKAAPNAEAWISCLRFAPERVDGGLSLGARLAFRHAAGSARGVKVLS